MREAMEAWLFISPTLAGFLIFFVGPLIAVVWYSLTEWNLLTQQATFVGLDNYGHVLTGNDRRTSFGKGDYLLIDRGSDHGVSQGSLFALYRNKEVEGNFLYDLGEAMAVSVSPDKSTLLVTVSRDAIQTGDLVAIRKPGSTSK